MAKKRRNKSLSAASNKAAPTLNSPHGLWSAFPRPCLWGAVFAVVAAALSLLGIAAIYRLTYIVGWLASLALFCFIIFFEWRKSYLSQSGAKQKYGSFLRILSVIFFAFASSLGIAAIAFYFNASAFHNTLIFHKPWNVAYGDILADGKMRIYVHARFNNNAGAAVKFQVYGKALVEPLSLNQVQKYKIGEKLRDDVRLLASGDDGVIMTANSRDDQNPTLFDIPGPVSSRQVFNGWRSGNATVFYAVIVYIKETDGTRLAFKDCVMSRAVIKSARAGEIPSAGTISVNYLWTDETPCYDTAVSVKSI